MRKLLALFLILVPAAGSAAVITRGPVSEDPTLNTMVVSWSTDVPAVSWLEYGPDEKHCDQMMMISPEGTEHKVTIHGLVQNKDFCYRVYTQNAGKDGVQEPVKGRFKTLFSPERKVVSFVVFGGTAGAEPEVLEKLSARLKEHNPDFFIHTGDLVESGLNSDADAEYFTPFKEVLASAPVFVTVGEKEYGPDRETAEGKNFFGANYRPYHTTSWGSGRPHYYYFDTAHARFIFLDTSAAAGVLAAPAIKEGSAQYRWLKNALSGVGPGRWKIAVMHLPAYSTDEDGSFLEVRETLGKLLEDEGAHLVLQGHESAYERTFPVRRGEQNSERGIVYASVTAGKSKRGKRVFKDDWTARFISTNVYGVGEIVDRKLTLKIFNLEGEMVDLLEIYRK